MHKDDDDIDIPTISMDYFFVGTKNIKAKDRTVLGLYDNKTRALHAFMVHQKGPVDWVVAAVTKSISDMGYGNVRIAIKCDAELAIRAVRDAVSMRRTAPTTPLDSPVREAQGNGGMERAIKTLQGQYRTLLLQLCDKLGEDVKNNIEMLQWLAYWIGMPLNRYMFHDNGKTSYQMTTGHTCRRPIAGVGEKISWKQSAKPGTRKDKGESEFKHGIFLGLAGKSSEALIGTSEGLQRAYTVRRVPEAERWSFTDIDELQSPMPHRLFGSHDEPLDYEPEKRPDSLVASPNEVETEELIVECIKCSE